MTLNPTPAEMAAILRWDLATFIERSFNHLHPETQYADNWHITLIASKLEACRQGKIKRLIINVPPRSMKSICASVAFPAYLLGHNPSLEIICASYGQDLSEKLGQDCLNLMNAEWYQRIFLTRLLSKRQPSSDFKTTRRGRRMATSVGGVLTGRGADFIIIDDPLKPDEAVSDVLRQRANDWFDGTVRSRFNNQKTGCLIIIMQRLHLDDLVGHVREQEGWDVLSLPAIAEEDECHEAETSSVPQQFKRGAGEALHPERESLTDLEKLRANLG